MPSFLWKNDRFAMPTSCNRILVYLARYACKSADASMAWHVSDGFGGQKFSKHPAHALLACLHGWCYCYENEFDLDPL